MAISYKPGLKWSDWRSGLFGEHAIMFGRLNNKEQNRWLLYFSGPSGAVGDWTYKDFHKTWEVI